MIAWMGIRPSADECGDLGKKAGRTVRLGRLPAIWAGGFRLPDQRRRQCGHGLDDRLQSGPVVMIRTVASSSPSLSLANAVGARARGGVVPDRLQHLVGGRGHQFGLMGRGRSRVLPRAGTRTHKPMRTNR